MLVEMVENFGCLFKVIFIVFYILLEGVMCYLIEYKCMDKLMS